MADDSEKKLIMLETRLNMYEQMIEKLDSAIEKISESNLNISRMLAVHDEKLENTLKTDTSIIEMVKKVEASTLTGDQNLKNRIDKLEIQVAEMFKYKWMMVGMGTLLAVFIASLANLASGWLTNTFPHVNIGKITQTET